MDHIFQLANRNGRIFYNGNFRYYGFPVFKDGFTASTV